MSESGHHTSGELHINWWEWNAHAPPIGWFFVDFFLFVALLIIFLKKPLKGLFQQRSHGIKKAISDAAEAHARATQKREETDQKRHNLENDVLQVIASSRQDAEIERERIEADAKAAAERIEAEAQALLVQEQKRLQERLRAYVAQAALDEAKKHLATTLTHAHQEKLLEQSIARLERTGGLA